MWWLYFKKYCRYNLSVKSDMAGNLKRDCKKSIFALLTVTL
jgi:hypothetical protein